MAKMRTYRDEYYPSDKMDYCEENMDAFFKFMHVRHLIWYRRFIKKLPRDNWTKDPILKVTKYTNIYRQLDRGSIWYLEHVVKPYRKEKKKDGKEEALKNLLWKTIVYRLCNRIETMEKVGLPGHKEFDPDDFYKKLDAIRLSGASVLTSAHLSCPTPKGLTKVDGYTIACNSLGVKLNSLTERIMEAKTPEDVFRYLKMVHCVGGFIAYEVYCDLCYSKAIPFTTNDFVNVGPGAKEGIRMIYPSTKGAQNILSKILLIWTEQDEHFKRIGVKFKYYNKYEPVENKLSLRSIEHSLCEFSKYWLQQRGLGKKRMLFDPDMHDSVITDGDSIQENKNKNWRETIKKHRAAKYTDDERNIIKEMRASGLTSEEFFKAVKLLREGA